MTGQKRRYYAVARGRRPGIYTAWEGPSGAKAQVKGFAGAVFKGFSSLQDAEHFLGNPPVPAGRGRPVTPKPSRVPGQLKGEGIHLYTDGGCIDNPGPGGWAAVIVDGDARTEISGGYRFTTNNRMELRACIEGLKSIREGGRVTLFTDSQYVANAVEKGWAKKWRSQNWMRDRTHRAENADLWAELLDLLGPLEVSFRWIRGHSGIPENERCDELARAAASGEGLLVDAVYERSRKESC